MIMSQKIYFSSIPNLSPGNTYQVLETHNDQMEYSLIKLQLKIILSRN